MGLLQVIKAKWLDFAIELIVGYLILKGSLNLFLLWALFVIVFEINLAKNHLRKLMRFFNISTEAKIMAFLRNEKIGEIEIKNELDGLRKKMGEEEWQELENDLKGI